MSKLTDENRLSVHFPELLKEWDYEKNVLFPEQISFGSAKKVWWKCDFCENEWETIIKERTRGRNCPECANIQRSKSVKKSKTNKNNLLYKKYPKLLKEWDYDKNDGDVKNHSSFSGTKVWWKCDKGHSWKTRIRDRTNNKSGCPYCAGQKPSIENNLSLHPISKEFDIEKNYPKTTFDFVLGSKQKVWWKCNKGHSWKAVIKNRTRKNSSGCPYCKRNFSKAEKEVLKFCKSLYKNKIETNKRSLFSNKNLEIDIWFPDLKFGIEYNGDYWHSFPEKQKNDLIKIQESLNNKYDLLIIWESDWNNQKEKIKNIIKQKIRRKNVFRIL